MKKVIIAVLFFVAACTKNRIPDQEPVFYTRYDFVNDWFAYKDTVFIKRVIAFTYDSVKNDWMKDLVSKYGVKWVLVCDTSKAGMHLEKWHHVKIQ